MEHAIGPEADLFVPKRNDGTRYVFFPGCQLGASDPEYVLRTWNLLTKEAGDEMGMFLSCCGAPAAWAGDTESHESVLRILRAKWKELDGPEFIVACATCKEMFREYLPGINITSLWEYWADAQMHMELSNMEDRRVAVFDPCSAQSDPVAKQSVRALLRQGNYEVQEIQSYEGGHYRCCGYGGLIYSSNPELFENITDADTSTDLPIVVYCVNCRDIFARKGKATLHVLDLLLFSDAEERAARLPVGLDQRRDN
jgi:Fe-S oxidoreductase